MISSNTYKVTSWIEQYIPEKERDPMNTCIKLSEEVSELLHALYSGEGDVGHELADVYILILDIAHLKGYDLQVEFNKKMVINRARTWSQDKGALSHD